MKQILKDILNIVLECLKFIPVQIRNYFESKSSFKGKYIHRNDKNGKHIHEGDIIRNSSGKVYQVRYLDNALAFVLFDPGDSVYIDWKEEEEWEIIK